MEHDCRLQIYRGVIHYLLESTGYTLKDIAHMSNSTVKSIRTIYCDGELPRSFNSEVHLVKLFQFILELNLKNNNNQSQKDLLITKQQN